MTDEQILKLAETCGFDKFQKRNFILIDGESEYKIQWECWEDQLLKFAALIYTEGFKVGYDEGWESSNVSTKWSSDDE